MNTARLFPIAAGFLVATGAMSCANRHQAVATSEPDADEALLATATTQWTIKPLPKHTVDLPVKEGSLPMAYLVESEGTIRIMDETSRSSMGEAPVTAQSIVSIDATRGARIDGRILSPGPLSVDHRYAVYYSIGGSESEVRQRTERTNPTIKQKNNSGQSLGP